MSHNIVIDESKTDELVNNGGKNPETLKKRERAVFYYENHLQQQCQVKNVELLFEDLEKLQETLIGFFHLCA